MSNDDTTKQLPTEDRLDTLIAIVHQMAADVKDMQARQISLEEELKDVKARLVGLEEKVDARLHDTRPMWEAVQARLDTIDTRLNRGDSRMDRMEGMLFELRADSRDLRDVLKEHFPALK